MRLTNAFSLLALAGSALADTVTYDWTIDWVTASPDGFARPVIGINGQWPCPLVQVNQGDTLIVNVQNNLGNETTGIHWHGFTQKGTPEMDGAVSASQCAIAPGSSFTYQFTADYSGTYWYHSHVMGQYPDGLRGPLIVNDPADPYADLIEEDVILTISDWYHSQTIPLVQAMLSPNNTAFFIPPVPDSMILNEGGSNLIPFAKGKTYRIRLINFSALSAAFVTFGSQVMQIVAQDGRYITPADAYTIRIDAAQRYDVILTCSESDVNEPYLVALDANPDYTNPNATPRPITFPYNSTGYLVVDPDGAFTETLEVEGSFTPIDDSLFSSATETSASLGEADQTIQIDFNFCVDANGTPQACFNGRPYVDQQVPALYTAATVGDDNTNPIVYGNVNPYILESGQTIDIIVNNYNFALHPFHLHGHHFQVLERPGTGAGPYPGFTTQSSECPAFRDTVTVYANSYAVLRFQADNPGVWLFHCHIEWHVDMGMSASMIEAPEQLRGKQFPQDHIDACKAVGQPYQGNAAGNTEDPLNTTGFVYLNPQPYLGALFDPNSVTTPQAKRARDERKMKRSAKKFPMFTS
ncbi:Cupredoxin [Coniella lustricola]|uniref:Cupredoxin n=1 Tax=Coniella lustricola TaxID=2025994 RepID=A0A2T3ACP8_9PEZI|nr:Cupredoxin [Coniella lustricola]